jgi:hypothetical protein
MLERVLRRGGCPLNAVDAAGETALHRAVVSENAASVELLLRQPGIDVNVCSALGGTPLQYAVCGHLTQIALRLIAMPQTDVNFGSEKCAAPIAIAINERLRECVRALCARGDLEVSGKIGVSNPPPLVIASALGDAESIECLLRCTRMDVEDPGCGAKAARANAIRLGLAECARLLTPPRKTVVSERGGEKKRREKVGFFRRLRHRRRPFVTA